MRLNIVYRAKLPKESTFTMKVFIWCQQIQLIKLFQPIKPKRVSLVSANSVCYSKCQQDGS